ncbi:MAG TPA: ATP-dependent DNA helicase RecG [Mycobacteriales bacterium]|nr:ATP-dependent DNA helicase RecG [Mycobacteriales bacterium]
MVKVVPKMPAELAEKLDVHTVGDLLRHYPRRYAQRAELTDLNALRVGDQVTVLADVKQVKSRFMRNRRGSMLEAIVGNDTGELRLTFFNKAPMHEKRLAVGTRALFAGKIGVFNGHRQLAHPEYELLDNPDTSVEEFAGGLIPIYPSTAKLPSWKIGKAVQVVFGMIELPADPLPDDLRDRYGLVEWTTAMRDIHRPSSRAAVTAATTRLKWDEAITLQLTLAQRRRAAAARPASPRPPKDGGLLRAFDEALPFTLTGGQQEIGAVLADELAAEHPMHRLLQGEVGSGKTLVALRAMLQVVDAGGQAALLAPTEVLAAQHARSVRALLGSLGNAGELGSAGQATRIALLTGSLSTAARRAALLDAASGAAGIVVGTHALIQEGVQFADLGLVVVDEQHRFGVEQRDALRGKANRPPHVLVMTATPIPRTVAMTVFGDLETSSLRELPRGRSPISTTMVSIEEKPSWLDRAWARIREEVAAGHQAYVVCPRIGDAEVQEEEEFLREEDSDESESAASTRRPPLAVLDVEPELVAGPLAGLKVEILHGRLPADEKDSVMRRFAAGDIDVLVATTVVEVGVDVPNATVMVIMDADRFGVSQLHQLRGRIGRGSAPGLCLLITELPSATPAGERLTAVASTVDGFALARLDLEQRREGNVLGAAQSGRNTGLQLLSLLRDEELITDARKEATAIVEADPELQAHPRLAAEVAAIAEKERADYLEKG